MRVVVWKRSVSFHSSHDTWLGSPVLQKSATVWHPLRSLEYRGYELEVTGLLFEKPVEIYDRMSNTFMAFDRNATYRLRGIGDTIYLRAAGTEEMHGFGSMLANETVNLN